MSLDIRRGQKPLTKKQWADRDMTLAELSLGCYMYATMTSFDGGYLEFLDETLPVLDLTQQSHRKSLLKFLNSWGCRIEKADFDAAATQIEEWYESVSSELFPTTTGLLSLTDSDLDTIEKAFKALADRPACKRKTFASVPTAKVLFALRPNALDPLGQRHARSLSSEWLHRLLSSTFAMGEGTTSGFERRMHKTRIRVDRSAD
jgi:hypothetical protein